MHRRQLLLQWLLKKKIQGKYYREVLFTARTSHRDQQKKSMKIIISFIKWHLHLEALIIFQRALSPQENYMYLLLHFQSYASSSVVNTSVKLRDVVNPRNSKTLTRIPWQIKSEDMSFWRHRILCHPTDTNIKVSHYHDSSHTRISCTTDAKHSEGKYSKVFAGYTTRRGSEPWVNTSSWIK